MHIDLKNKNILVTGAAGLGVGAGVCEAIVACGGYLFLNDLDIVKTEEAAKRYSNSVVITGDVSNPEDVESIFKYINETYGVVNGLVNNAGVGLSKKAHDATNEDFDKIYNIDIRGLWLMSKAFVKQLIVHNATGNIVNISSVHAHATMSKYAIYGSAKSAVNGLTRGMSIELGELGIRCNSVSPGYVYADHNYKLLCNLTDDPKQWVEDYINEYQCLNHTINARDCGNAVAFLLSNLSKSITGQDICVDAGSVNMICNNSFSSQKSKKFNK